MSEEAGAAQPMGELDRLVGVLFDPKPVFADIATKPRWWIPLILLTVLIVSFTFAFSKRVGWEGFMRQELEMSSRTRNLPAEQKERILEQQMRFVPIFAQVQAGLAFGLIALVVAAVFLFVFNILAGAELGFKAAWGVTCYAFLPQVFGILLAIAVLFLKDPADFDLRNPVASNLAAFLDPSTTPAWLFGLAASLDIFVVWVLLLLATGFSAAARKLSWWRSLTWVTASWIVWVAVKCGWIWIWS